MKHSLAYFIILFTVACLTLALVVTVANAHPSKRDAYAQGLSNCANRARGNSLLIKRVSKHRKKHNGTHYRRVWCGWVLCDPLAPSFTPCKFQPMYTDIGPHRRTLKVKVFKPRTCRSPKECPR